jgi:hypothetical protein
MVGLLCTVGFLHLTPTVYPRGARRRIWWPSARQLLNAVAVFILNRLFSGGSAPGCIATTDANGDSAVDRTYDLLNYLFLEVRRAKNRRDRIGLSGTLFL